MKAIGRRGERITGYPCVSVYDTFTRGKALCGAFLDWLYEHMGIIAFSTELWDVPCRAGLERRDRAPTPDEDEEDGLKLLAWNDRELGGRGFVPWYPFDHQQLGPVELGGWDRRFTLWNPPLYLLEGECHKNAMFTLAHAAALPRLIIRKAAAVPVGRHSYIVEAVVVNAGYLPTYVAEPGKEMKWAAGPSASLTTPEGARVVHGGAVQDLGHLAGRAQALDWRSAEGREKRVTWVVTMDEAKPMTVTVEGARAGRARADISPGEGQP